jgi:hypothetical protein
MWGALSDERTGLSFTIAAGPRERSHSWVGLWQDSWPYLTVSASRHPQPGGLGLRIYIPQEQGGPVVLAGTGFPFHRLPRLAWLQWRYWNPPPHGDISSSHWLPLNGSLPSLNSVSTDRTENVSSIIACSLVGGETTCPQRSSLATVIVLSPVCTAVTWQWVYMLHYYH